MAGTDKQCDECGRDARDRATDYWFGVGFKGLALIANAAGVVYLIVSLAHGEVPALDPLLDAVNGGANGSE